jgi:hypothetical protein
VIAGEVASPAAGEAAAPRTAASAAGIVPPAGTRRSGGKVAQNDCNRRDFRRRVEAGAAAGAGPRRAELPCVPAGTAMSRGRGPSAASIRGRMSTVPRRWERVRPRRRRSAPSTRSRTGSRRVSRHRAWGRTRGRLRSRNSRVRAAPRAAAAYRKSCAPDAARPERVTGVRWGVRLPWVTSVRCPARAEDPHDGDRGRFPEPPIQLDRFRSSRLLEAGIPESGRRTGGLSLAQRLLPWTA